MRSIITSLPGISISLDRSSSIRDFCNYVENRDTQDQYAVYQLEYPAYL